MHIPDAPGPTRPVPSAPSSKHRIRGRVARAAGLATLAAALLLAGRAITAKPPAPGRITAASPLIPASPAHARIDLIYSVYSPDGDASTFLSARALGTSTPRALFTVDHMAGYPPAGSVTSDGAHIALARIPKSAPPRSPAEILVIDTATGTQAVADTRADPMTRPIISPAGDYVYYLRTALAPEPTPEEMRNGKLREVSVELVRHHIASRQTAVIRSEILVDLNLLGVDTATGEPVAVRRTHLGASVVAIRPDTGALRTIATPGTGRELRRATLDAGGRFVLLDELAPGDANALLLRVPTSGGPPEALRAIPADNAPSLATASFIARPEGANLVLDPIASAAAPGKPLTIHPLRRGAVELAVMALSTDGRFLVTRSRAGATQVYAIADAHTGGSRPLPAPPGRDLFGLNAGVVGFVTGRQ